MGSKISGFYKVKTSSTGYHTTVLFKQCMYFVCTCFWIDFFSLSRLMILITWTFWGGFVAASLTSVDEPFEWPFCSDGCPAAGHKNKVWSITNFFGLKNFTIFGSIHPGGICSVGQTSSVYCLLTLCFQSKPRPLLPLANEAKNMKYWSLQAPVAKNSIIVLFFRCFFGDSAEWLAEILS